MMADERSHTMPPRKLRRPLVGVVLVLASAAWLIWGPAGSLCYLAGLFNSMEMLTKLSLLALLFLPAAVLLPILGVYAAMRWREQTWRDVLLLVAVGGFVVPIVLGFAGLGTGPIDMYMRGFTRCARPRVDIEAIRSRLNTQDPNDYTDRYGGVTQRFLEKSGQPAPPENSEGSVGRGSAPYTAAALGRRPYRSLGVVVGRKEMPMPPSDSYTQHVPLAPGAYIWSGD